MSGHSKWATIKRQKARVDAARGKNFAQLSGAIIVAARSGIPDPAGNFQLRTAIEKAKAAGVPNDNIDRAIAKGAGTLGNEADKLEEIRYEGYGPGGVALVIEALTDNRNRTAADLRAIFNKRGGNLGETGCVSWMFAHKGVCMISGAVDEDALLEASLAGDAEYYELFADEEEAGAEVFTATASLEKLCDWLRVAKFNVTDSEFRWIPGNTVEVLDLEHGKQLLKSIESFEALDDVQSVTANFEISAELLLALAT
jgi:YebC/PmpR family DNA-binding regulatory protein